MHAVALERKAWSEPASSGAISDRGRLQACICTSYSILSYQHGIEYTSFSENGRREG